jgi:hypothetical protein
MTLTVGSLFSGIGGFDLGLERAGMQVIWQSEIDEFASRVLKKHWPDVPNLGDITKVDWSEVERPDVICGGYPCQPFSQAGKRGGENDARHLWQCTTPFAYYDLDTRLWKTYEGICLWGSVEFSATWPKSGMTQSGKSFQQPPLVRYTKETGYSLWPTPTTQETEHLNAELTTTGRRKSKNGKSSHSLNLADAVQKWPTPMAQGAGGSGHWNMVEKMYLENQISYEEKMALQAGRGGKLNPAWVEWLMGFPIGWTDLKD